MPASVWSTAYVEDEHFARLDPCPIVADSPSRILRVVEVRDLTGSTLVLVIVSVKLNVPPGSGFIVVVDGLDERDGRRDVGDLDGLS